MTTQHVTTHAAIARVRRKLGKEGKTLTRVDRRMPNYTADGPHTIGDKATGETLERSLTLETLAERYGVLQPGETLAPAVPTDIAS